MRNPFIDAYGLTLCGLFALALVVVATASACAIGAVFWAESAKCSNMRALGAHETYVSISTGCLVKYKGDWVTADAMLSHQIEVRTK